ncbi:MAG: hypothetical protein IPM46_04120 [Flavobacteriales bacterium]|nr:hypothetical protein [Flavobacteriales bacterium]
MIETEASFNGTLRTILVLLALWWLIRLFMRSHRQPTASRERPMARPKGDVRIEDPRKDQSPTMPSGRIVDADFEEIK